MQEAARVLPDGDESSEAAQPCVAYADAKDETACATALASYQSAGSCGGNAPDGGANDDLGGGGDMFTPTQHANGDGMPDNAFGKVLTVKS